MGLLQIVADIFLTRKQKAQRELIAIAQRECTGKETKNDAELLLAALLDTGQTEGDYQKLLDVVKKHAALTAAADVEPKRKTAIAAAKTRDSFFAEHEALWKKRTDKQNELNSLAAQADAELQQAERALLEKQALEYSHADLLGMPLHDLNKFNLQWEQNICWAHSDAKIIGVPSAVYYQESLRRAEILKAAEETALRDHEIAVDAWHARRPGDLTREGRWLWDQKNPPPSLTFKKWSDLHTPVMA